MLPAMDIRRLMWPTLIGVGLMTFVVVWLAPAERTLGDGIKWVYVHVALTWTGMTALAAAGALGLIVLITARPSLAAWMEAAGLVGLGFFALGLIISLIAAQVNWGGIFWDEPRLRGSFQVLAAGVIALVAARTPLARRWVGLLFAGVAVLMVVSLAISPLVLHPRSAVWSSPSWMIQASFGALYALFSLVAVVMVRALYPPLAVVRSGVSQ